MKNILVVGSLNVDMTIQSDRMPQLGKTMTGFGFSVAAGGKGANQAAAAAMLGAPVRLLGAVGNDANGKAVLPELSKRGVDCTCVRCLEGPTGVAMIVVVNGDNCILIDHGANYALLPESVAAEEAIFDWADYMVMQLEIPLETVEAAARMAKAHGAQVILNPAPMNPLLDGRILQNVDLLIPNEHEAADLAGFALVNEETAQRAAAEIFKNYGCRVIITLGEKGSLYFDGTKMHMQPAFSVKTVDTTAAGDSYIGGLCASLADGEGMEEAMCFATAVSAHVVQRRGALPSLPTRAEAEAQKTGMLRVW